jgi:predicted transposase/invertase (TIGR01784 family)
MKKITQFINPFTDFGFKKLFGEEENKDLLIDFLNTLLPESQQIVTLTYQPTEQNGLTAFDRKAIYDLYCEGAGGSKFIVEMQKAKQTYFKDRAVYYTTFPIQAQAKKGKKSKNPEEENEEWDYKLAPTYMVSVLDFTFEDDPTIPEDTVIYFVNLKDQFNRPFFDKLLYINLEMPRFLKTIPQLLTLQDDWLYILKNLPEMEDVPERFRQGRLAKIFKVADMANLTREERQAYEQSVKQYRDLKNVTDTAFRDGELKGKLEGKIEGKIESILNGHEAGLPLEMLVKISKLPEQQVLEIIRQGSKPTK